MNLFVHIGLKSTSEGGRENNIFSGYRPTLRMVNGESSDCVITVNQPMNPGSNGRAVIEVLHPDKFSSVKIGDKFTLTEGVKVIATGFVVL